MFDIMDLEDDERNKLLKLDDSQMQARNGDGYSLLNVFYYISVCRSVGQCLLISLSVCLFDCLSFDLSVGWSGGRSVGQ